MMKKIIIFAYLLSFNTFGALKLDSIGEVISVFESLSLRFTHKKDFRLVFAKTYLEVSKAIEKEILKNTYNYPEFIEAAVIEFALFYIDSLAKYKNNETVPLAWQEAFNLNDQKFPKLSIHLLLSMNAHISHDLPIALEKVFQKGWDPVLVQSDYFKMNKMFEELIPQFFKLLYKMEITLSITQKKVVKDYLILEIVKSMRENAWKNAIKLFNLSDKEKVDFKEKINQESGDTAEIIFHSRYLIPAH